MKHSILFKWVLFVSLFLFQCKKESDLDTNKNITIIVQPFANFPKSRVTTVVKEIRKIYKNCKVNPAISFPQDSWNAAKSRRRADKLIKYLNNLAETDQLYIGLTSEDISTTKNQYKDWGVFGLGYRSGKSCIASTFRLKGNKDVKLFKIAIHELGHTQGLSHCPIASCFMRNAKGKDVLDFETEFCSSCKAVLLQKGWQLK